VEANDPAEVRLDALGSAVLHGRVAEIAASATAPVGTFEALVQVSDPPAGLKSGLIAKVEITPSRQAGYRFVPALAVTAGDGPHALVFTLAQDGHHARKVPVEVAFLTGSEAAVARGLEGVDTVVTEGAGFLTDGMAVQVVR